MEVVCTEAVATGHSTEVGGEDSAKRHYSDSTALDGQQENSKDQCCLELPASSYTTVVVVAVSAVDHFESVH